MGPQPPDASCRALTLALLGVGLLFPSAARAENTMSTELERIAAADPVHAETMQRSPTTFSTEALPFYRRFKLLKAVVQLPHRPLLFEYADDGKQVVQLTGEARDVYKVNGLEGLTLEVGQVAAYLRFYLAHADSSARVQLVERPTDLAWLPSTETEATAKGLRAAASARLRPAEVSAHLKGFNVSAFVLAQGKLTQGHYQVDAKGQVTLTKSEPVMQNLPVATVY